jgi:hypothetical protein
MKKSKRKSKRRSSPAIKAIKSPCSEKEVMEKIFSIILCGVYPLIISEPREAFFKFSEFVLKLVPEFPKFELTPPKKRIMIASFTHFQKSKGSKRALLVLDTALSTASILDSAG